MDINDEPITSMYKSGSKYILGFSFKVSKSASKIDRKIFNIEEMIGQLGGIYGLLEVLILLFLHPFTKDAITEIVASKTKAGKQIGIDSRKFYIKRIVMELLCCTCLRREMLRNKHFRD